MSEDEKTYTGEELETAVNAALDRQVTTNESGDSIRRRIAAMASGGYDFADTLHNVYLDYGYPATLDFSNYWNMYRRFGLARTVVDLPADRAWITTPTIEGLDSSFGKFTERLKFWHRMKALDIRQRVGRYAGLFMRISDGKLPDQPLEPASIASLDNIVDITPLYESQLKVLTVEQDASSPRLGQPLTYQYSSTAPGGRNEKASISTTIHWSRVVIAAEGADTGDIYGVSELEAPYNSLMDLRKVIGGGAEGFYKNAAQNVVFSVKDLTAASRNAEALENFSAQYNEFDRNRSRRAIMAPGMDVTALESSLINPKEFFNAALNDIASASQIPSTILIGQQTGRLASGEDSEAFNANVQSRRVNFLTQMIGDVIDWCITAGAIPSSDYEVVWDDLLALSDKSRLENAGHMSKINSDNFRAGGGQVFSEAEIRTAAGMEDPKDVPPTPDESIDPVTPTDGTE